MKRIAKFLFKPFKNKLLKMFLKNESKPKIFEIPQNTKCLCLAPHPDDEVIGLGGTILKYAKQFDVICLTNGCCGIENLSKQETTKIRSNEFKNAMEFAGVNSYKMLNIPDKHLIDGYSEFLKIDFSSYDYIFVPHYIDQHRDHKAVCLLLYRMLNENKNKFKKDVKILLYEVWAPLAFVNKCVDIGGVIEGKKTMLDLYPSQMAEKPYKDATLGLAKFRGLLKKAEYAEAFCLVDVNEFKTTVQYLYDELIDKEEKVFLVFNTACFGDVLLCNSLIQNIKNIFPESKVVFVCDKNWYDAAKYQEGVDEVVTYDKSGRHWGFFGMLKFIKSLKYRKPYASIITYRNERNFIVSKIIGSRYIVSESKELFHLSKQEQHTMLLNKMLNIDVKNLPIKFNVPSGTENKVKQNGKYAVLCTISKNNSKDMPLDTAEGLINLINKTTGYKVVLTGVGQRALAFAKELTKRGNDFINLVNQTSLLELAQITKDAEYLISVDTGTMHLGYSVNTPTVGVFYEKDTTLWWAPDRKMYNTRVVDNNQTPDNIMQNVSEIYKQEVSSDGGNP